MTRESLFSTAQAFGIGKDALEACVAKAETHQSIVNQINEGSANGVEGTPAIFVNGRSVRTAFNPRVLTQILDQYLKP
jgi:protein-disulfide isomerase